VTKQAKKTSSSDLAEARRRLEEASDHFQRKMSIRLSQLCDDYEGNPDEVSGDVVSGPRASRPSWPREEQPTTPDHLHAKMV
jgi:hypothetical protein